MTSGPILYVLKRFPRLSETFVLREILTLEALGERILVDSLLPAEDGPRHPDLDRVQAEVRYLPKHPRLRDPSVRRSHLRLALRRPARWLRLATRARRAGTWRRFLQAGLSADRARREGVRHIHAHFLTAAAEVARDAAALSGIPLTATAHAKDIFHKDNVPLIRSRVRGAAALVTVSEHNVGYLRRVIGNGMPIRFVPNGVALASPANDRPNGPVLCVARLVPKKGVDTLIDAGALLTTRLPGLSIEVVGDGPEAQPLCERVRTLGMTDRVRFLGQRPWDDVERAFRRCSIVALPCRVDANGDRDGMPTVLVEALALGLPVVSTDVAGISELVRDGETGLLVRPDDPAALADAIDRLARDRPLARRLGRAGRALVAERFDPMGSARLLQRVFEGVRA
ncbi:MAG TPA: glycosyltransferase family 4 protein [Actinomycetota bacterium]|nr:glycosyltransferase family 4 protein [Actinomycetota bacterium]